MLLRRVFRVKDNALGSVVSLTACSARAYCKVCGVIYPASLSFLLTVVPAVKISILPQASSLHALFRKRSDRRFWALYHLD